MQQFVVVSSLGGGGVKRLRYGRDFRNGELEAVQGARWTLDSSRDEERGGVVETSGSMECCNSNIPTRDVDKVGGDEK